MEDSKDKLIKKEREREISGKYTYSFPRVPIWYPAIYSVPLLSLFPFSIWPFKSLLLPRDLLDSSSHDPGDFVFLYVSLQTDFQNKSIVVYSFIGMATVVVGFTF